LEYNVQYVCCEEFALRDGTMPSNAGSLAQRRGTYRALLVGDAEGEV